MTFTYEQQNIDDQIVSEALGGDARVVDVEATVVGQPKPARRNKTRTVMYILVAGLLVLGSLGVYLKDRREMNVSPDLAAIMANAAKPAAETHGADAPVQQTSPGAEDQEAATAQGGEAGAEAAAPGAAPDGVAVPPGDGAAKVVLEAPSTTPSVPTDSQAVTASPVSVPAVGVVAPQVPPLDSAANAASQDAQRKLEKLNADIAARKTELDALNAKVGEAKKVLASTMAEEKEAKARVAAAKREAQKLAAKPAPAKPAQAAQKPVDRVMAILSDGVVLHDGDVIDVGTSSPKVGGRLTAVNPAAGLIEVNGEARRVVVDPS